MDLVLRWNRFRTFEDQEGDDKSPFDVKVGIYLAEGGLQRRLSEQIR
jgi:hypothetical protein